jgi:predicted DNA-binding transcriptional regulator AlpA
MRVDKQQFQLPLAVTKCRPRTRPPSEPERPERTLPERVAGIDQVLRTHDVERITGRHRCTIYRWVRAGTFPEKRAGGGRGWLRSDVERWLQGGGSTDGDTPKALSSARSS